MSQVELLPVGLSMLLCGAALQFVLRVVYGLRRPGSSDAMRLGLSLGAAMLAIGGLFLVLVATLGWLAVFACPVVLLCLLTSLAGLRLHERRVLLWSLAAASERRIPLSAVVRALALEQGNENGQRAMHLAALLEAGLPLATAFQRAKVSLDVDSQLQIRLASETGEVPPRFGTSTCDTELREVLQRLGDKFLYLLVVLFLMLVLALLTINARPPLNLARGLPTIVRDFGGTVPPLTQTVTSLLSFSSLGHAVALCLVLIILFAGALFLVVTRLYRSEFLRTDLFGTDFGGTWMLERTRDRARFLRGLGALLKRGIDFAGATDLLSRTFPKANVRHRAARAAQQIRKGIAWSEALQQQGFVSPSENSLLRAAERAGNLPWALEEAAEATSRRLIRRLLWFQSLLFPILLVLLGGGTLVFCLALFEPLVELISTSG